MALKVKAREKLLKFSKDSEGVWKWVMQPELYSALTQSKVIKEAALRSGVSEGVMQACWDAAGEVIKAWLPEGHSIPLPGLGSCRFSLSASSVDDVNKVKTSLIKTRRIIFTPDTDLKSELSSATIQITCYDRNGEEVKRVTSTDPGTVEDTEELTPDQEPTPDPSLEGGESGDTGNGGGGTTPSGGDDDPENRPGVRSDD
jgi:predicted histone-like DNA-binding protein